MMKRYSPLAGLAERRRRLVGVVEKDTSEAERNLPETNVAGADEFSWNNLSDLTRAPEDATQVQAAETQGTPRPEETHSASPEQQNSEPPAEAAKAAPADDKPRRRSSRVKTTLLGFDRSDGRTEELFKEVAEKKPSGTCKFPTGWLVVVEGPGLGTAISLHEGVAQIGRGDDQAVQLDFGDNSISRENHAAIAYDSEARAFYLGHGGKTNIVRLNGSPVLSTEPLNDDDHIRIGETTMRFVAFCNDTFNWSDKQAD